MKKLFYLILTAAAMCVSAASLNAQDTGLYLDQSSFAPIQSDMITGVNIDPIGKDRSNRECARIKIALDRMSPDEVSGVNVKPIGGNILVMKRDVAIGGNGIIVEMTARPGVRFQLVHGTIGSSNVVTVDLEGNKEYSIRGWSNLKKTITVDCGADRAGAQVYLDGEYKGQIQANGVCSITDVTIAEHTIRVSDGNATGEEVVNVTNSQVYFKIAMQAERMQYVTITVKPQDANPTVTIDGQFLMVQNGVAFNEVRVGTHSYEVTSDRYHTVRNSVTVTADNPAEIYVEMVPNYGYLNVTETSAAKGAVVLVDKKQVGVVPYRGELPSGNHEVSIVQRMYNPYNKTVTIKDGQTTNLVPELNANFAEINFTVDKNADIYLDNKPIGKGKATYKVEYGSHRIECRKDGHETSARTLKVTSAMNGQTIALTAPKPIYGTLSVQSIPIGATIYVDGEQVGKTPMTINNVIVGARNVEVKLTGYMPLKKTVQITKDRPQYITAQEATLRKEDRDVTVSLTTAYDAMIYVDGAYVGKGKWTGIIKEGQHKFEARKLNYNDGVLDYYLRYNDGKPVNLTIPNPTEKTGALNITTNAGGSIYIKKDGTESSYSAPYSNRYMPVGNYSAYASKKGYHSSPTKYFTVYENETTNIDLDMRKIGWLEKNTSYYTIHAAEVTYGFGVNTSDYYTGSENYIGLNYSYAPKAMGFHTSLMYGVDGGDFGMTVGPLIHLSNYTDTDWQLYAGIGARYDAESDAYDPLFGSYEWHWLVDAGIRMNFDEFNDDLLGTELSFASLSLGCKFSSDIIIPTVGLSFVPAFSYLLAENDNWDFAAHFAGVSMGYDIDMDDFMMGAYYSYCRTQLGFYTNFLVGFEESYSIAAGPVIRLTDDYSFCDWQLYGGIGVQNNEFMGDFGMRFGWQSSTSFSWWDFSLGCQVYDGCYTPTMTLGLGVSLTAILTACTVALAALEEEGY